MSLGRTLTGVSVANMTGVLTLAMSRGLGDRDQHAHRRPGFAAATTDSTWARDKRNSRPIAAGLRPDSNAASTNRSCPGAIRAGRA